MWAPTFPGRDFVSGGQKGKGEGGLGRGSSGHVLGSAPRQLRGSAPVTAASVSPAAPGGASEGKLCVAGSLWPGGAFSAYASGLWRLPSRVYWRRYSNLECVPALSIIQTSHKRKKKEKSLYRHHPLLQGFLNPSKVAHKQPFCLLQRPSK